MEPVLGSDDSSEVESSTLTSSSISTGSIVKTHTGQHSVFVLCADEDDSEWAEENIINPLESQGISCFYEERDFPLGHHLLDLIRRSVKHHPVTILPLTKAFNRRYDDSMFTWLLAENWYKDHMVICVKAETECRVPKSFDKITNIDFAKIAGDKDLCDRMRARLFKDVKRYLDRRERLKAKRSGRTISNQDFTSVTADTSIYGAGEDRRQPTEEPTSVTSRISEVDSTQTIEDATSVDYDFVSIDNLENPSPQHFGPHVRHDVLKREHNELEKLGIKFKIVDGIDRLLSYGKEVSPEALRRTEQFILHNEIPAHSHDGDYLTELFKSSSENVTIAALKSYRQHIMVDVLAPLYNYTAHQWSSVETSVKSLLDSEDIISSSLADKTSPKVAFEKILTYKEVLTAIVFCRLLGSITRDDLPSDTGRAVKAINFQLHIWTQRRMITPGEDDRRHELEYNARICLKCLERIRQDADSWKKLKSSVGRLSPRPSSSKLDALSVVLNNLLDSEKKKEIRNIDGFDTYLTLRHFEFAVLYSPDESKTNFLNKLQWFSYILMKKRSDISEMQIMPVNSVLTTLLENADDDKEICQQILLGDTNSQRLGYNEFWEEAFKRSSDKLKQTMKRRLKSMIYHYVPAVAEMAQRRTVLKKSTPWVDAKMTDVSIEELNNINKDFITRSCEKIALCVKSLGVPVPKSSPDTLRWMWKGAFFGATVNVHVCNYLQPSARRSVIYGGVGQTPLHQFDRELNILKKLHQHKYIIDLVGFQRNPFPIFMMIEYHGENLVDFLTDRVKRGQLLSLRDLLNTICDPMVKAVEFCHKNNIVLRDVIAKNFSIKTNGYEKFTLKYYGFELAWELMPDGGKHGRYKVYEAIGEETSKDADNDCYIGTKDDQIPTRWSAPESLLAPHHFSRKSDSWMLGCTLYEVLTHGCQPYTELYGMTSEEVAQQVLWGVRIKQPACIPDELYAILLGSLMIRSSRRQNVQKLSENIERYRSKCPKLGPTDISKLHPPPDRDQQQPREPDRGIPIGLRDTFDYTSALRYRGNQTNILPCQPDEITSSDQQSPARGSYQFGRKEDVYLEEKLLPSLFPYGRSRDEIECLTHLSHPFVGRVLDFRLDEDKLIQISEYYDVKNNLLQTSLMRRDSVDTLIEQLRQVASAMTYLHSEEIGLIHCDLRASNIYITQDEQIRVGRLGRACLLEVGLYDLGLTDSVKIRDMPMDQLRWAPLEVVRGGIYSQASDVFMFANVSWEVFNAHSADPETVTREMLVPHPHTSADKIPKALGLREHQLQPPECPNWLYMLMNKCWLDERSRRPSFAVIEECLRERSLQPMQSLYEHTSGSNEKKQTYVEAYKALDEEDSDIYMVYTRGNIEQQENRDHIYYTHNISNYDVMYGATGGTGGDTDGCENKTFDSKGDKLGLMHKLVKRVGRVFKRHRKEAKSEEVESTYLTIESTSVKCDTHASEILQCCQYENLSRRLEECDDDTFIYNDRDAESAIENHDSYYQPLTGAATYTTQEQPLKVQNMSTGCEISTEAEEDGYLLPSDVTSLSPSCNYDGNASHKEEQTKNESLQVKEKSDESDYSFYSFEGGLSTEEYKEANIVYLPLPDESNEMEKNVGESHQLSEFCHNADEPENQTGLCYDPLREDKAINRSEITITLAQEQEEESTHRSSRYGNDSQYAQSQTSQHNTVETCDSRSSGKEDYTNDDIDAPSQKEITRHRVSDLRMSEMFPKKDTELESTKCSPSKHFQNPLYFNVVLANDNTDHVHSTTIEVTNRKANESVLEIVDDQTSITEDDEYDDAWSNSVVCQTDHDTESLATANQDVVKQEGDSSHPMTSDTTNVQDSMPQADTTRYLDEKVAMKDKNQETGVPDALFEHCEDSLEHNT